MTSKLVALDLLTYHELKHLIGHAASGTEITDQMIGMIAAALVAQQGGLAHEKAQAWEQGRSDYILGLRYPWVGSHLVNPFDIEEENND